MNLGERIRERRKKLGFTQIEVAEQLNMGRSNFGHIENGRVIPTSTDLDKIADILNTNVDYLLGRTDDPDQERVKNSLGWILNLNESGFLDFFKKNAHPILYEHIKDKNTIDEIVNLNNELFSSLKLEKYKFTAEWGDDLQSKIMYLTIMNDLVYQENNEEPPYVIQDSNLKANSPINESILSSFNLINIPIYMFIRHSKTDNSEKISSLTVESDILEGADGFALKIRDDEMSGDRINAGSLAIVKYQDNVDSNDIAVVSVYENQAVLRRIKKQGDMYMLIPSNPIYSPDLVPSKNVHIFGKVVEVRFWI
ncbi:helix-turn-helix domain-containing protein [Paenibacillus cucumis (ex Kampfer et al. 2016)]|uniref:Helix-turn-helix domain-containing protein n=1 Tax=Paenibacillus cucumis (ex Kampfer et al. 2016) TaxID=1776858 RepID=A0ABS7KCX9_9BACL|nr:S24 family peptidase [Paenibacillus cucumis (ex Kampfer et al. 2016)]MBY0201998.1 helix-turn-helix domain-containing protein [Paenibacillus cucumis (ex Kampfer et al. 2016)]